MLLEHESFLWSDTSGRFQPCFNDDKYLTPTLHVLEQSGIVMFRQTDFSVRLVVTYQSGVAHQCINILYNPSNLFCC